MWYVVWYMMVKIRAVEPLFNLDGKERKEPWCPFNNTGVLFNFCIDIVKFRIKVLNTLSKSKNNDEKIIKNCLS